MGHPLKHLKMSHKRRRRFRHVWRKSPKAIGNTIKSSGKFVGNQWKKNMESMRGVVDNAGNLLKNPVFVVGILLVGGLVASKVMD